jgi:heptosyltransferase-3
MDLSSIQRIGVFKLRNIGDVLIITPALRALRETFPRAHITVVVNSVTDAMLENNPHIDSVIVYQRPRRGATIIEKAISEVKYWNAVIRSRLDLAIDFTCGDRPAFSTWLSGAKIRVASYQFWKRWDSRNFLYTHVLPPLPPGHEVEQHLWILKQIGIEAPDQSLCLKVSPHDREWAGQIVAGSGGERIVHVHPVARWLFKCWDDQKMASVIDWLERVRRIRVVVTASSDHHEIERTRRILGFCQSKPIFLAGQSTLTQLSALSQRASCFFGVDTAPMHIAAAVGTPVIALFGPTYPSSWGPWCDKKIVLRKRCACEEACRLVCDWNKVRDCLEQISVDEVKEALAHFV